MKTDAFAEHEPHVDFLGRADVALRRRPQQQRLGRLPFERRPVQEAVEVALPESRVVALGRAAVLTAIASPRRQEILRLTWGKERSGNPPVSVTENPS